MSQTMWYLRRDNLLLKTNDPQQVLGHVAQGWRIIDRAEFESTARMKLDQPKRELPFRIAPEVREKIRRLVNG